MSVAFSVKTTDDYLQAEEHADTGHVTLKLFNAVGENASITVDAGDLARALVTASPTFATGLSELVQRAILTTLGTGDDDAGDEEPSTL